MKNGYIITIGDEILIGQILDTNSAWIASRLNECGISVRRRLSVGDRASEIAQALDEALGMADIVILTGGLGPTKDDITKSTLADYFGCGLVEDPQVTAMVRRMLVNRGVAFNDLNRSQAYVPQCCRVLPNHNGTAPGMWFEREGKIIVSLPGVPFEMKPLVDEAVIPRIKDFFGLDDIYHKTLLTFGLPESMLAETISGWEDSLPGFLRLAYLPNPSGIRLRLSAYGVEKDRAREAVEESFSSLERLIPANIVGYGDSTLQSQTGRILTERGQKLALAESCTGGALSASFTANAGASAYFTSGVVCYSNLEKERLLGVDPEAIEKYGAVSSEVAEQMATGARERAGVDYAISTTGIAGPDGGSAEKPVGTVWIAVAGEGLVVSRKMSFGKLRSQNIERAVANAVNMLRLILLGFEVP